MKHRDGIKMYCPHNRKSRDPRQKDKARVRLNKFYNQANPCQVKGWAKLNIDNSYTITSIELAHNHSTNAELYGGYQSVRSRIENIHKPNWLTYTKVKAKPKNVAEVLSEELKVTYSAKDIHNRFQKVRVTKEIDAVSLKTDIENKGGRVRYSVDSTNQQIKTLWVQTKHMKDELYDCNPNLFETDLTHQTNSNNYKLWIATYLNTKYDRWDVAGLLFLAMESQDNVKQGIEYFRLSLPSSEMPGIFMVDKDFNFMDILQSNFPSSIILLCAEHTKRYFKEKVLICSKSFWLNGSYLKQEEKVEILNLIDKVRCSESMEIYHQEEERLMSKTQTLVVKPGNVKNTQWFHDYYTKNWKSCEEKWVWLYRKRLLTLGSNDTNAAEATFSVTKDAIRNEFNGHLPTINQLLYFLPNFFDKRIRRNNLRDAKTFLSPSCPEPSYQNALTKASSVITRTGVKLFHKACNSAVEEENKLLVNLQEETVTEKFKSGYLPKYRISENCCKCNCSSYARLGICKHLVIFRRYKGIPVFNINMFNPCLIRRDYRPEGQAVIPIPMLPPRQEIENQVEENNAGLTCTDNYQLARRCTDLTAELVSNLDSSACEKFLQVQMKLNEEILNGSDVNTTIQLHIPSSYEKMLNNQIEQYNELIERETLALKLKSPFTHAQNVQLLSQISCYNKTYPKPANSSPTFYTGLMKKGKTKPTKRKGCPSTPNNLRKNKKRKYY